MDCVGVGSVTPTQEVITFCRNLPLPRPLPAGRDGDFVDAVDVAEGWGLGFFREDDD